MTRETVRKNLEAGNYNDLNKKVYNIDRYILGKIVLDFTEKKDISKIENVEDAIDKGELLVDLLKTAKERRCKDS